MNANPMSTVRFVRGELDAAAMLGAGPDSVGAVALFLGVVRAEARGDGAALAALEYSAYEEMALAQLRDIAAACREQFGVAEIEIVHRLGVVPVGRAAVLVAVRSGHRGPALDACREVMERVKADVPIFKREVWADGSTTWVAGVDC
jgi:molybdopterin synthase catalytic subunit